MLHQPPPKQAKDNATPYKTRLGLWMFAAYSIFYAGFVIINAVKPTLLGRPTAIGNLAVAYGMGLIVVALIEAAIYNHLCNKAEAKLNAGKEAAE